MSEKKNIVLAGASIAGRNKRYVIWFYLLNLVCAWLGASGLGIHAHAILDHSLYSDRLLHGFDLAVFVELINLPDFGPVRVLAGVSTIFALLFFCVSLVLMPGVLLGYASHHRLPRDQFYRACGRNVWRFVRLFLFLILLAGPVSGLLYWGLDALVTAADQTSNERLPFFTQVAGTILTLLILTIFRIWFDLAQTDVVLRDQGTVGNSLGSALRTMRHNLGRLLASYILIDTLALGILAGGILSWNGIVPPSSVTGAFIISQTTSLLLLAVRFWQRATAVAFYEKQRDGLMATETHAVGALENSTS